MHKYDVIVLGGGSAGTAAARAASRAGARTAMINDGELGGLCILRGCMPTKALLASAHAIHEANHMEELGGRLEGRAVADFPFIMQRKDRLVARFKKAKVDAIDASDYEVVDGRARFAEGGAVEVDGRRLSARSYVIATGSVADILPVPGIENVPVLTSDDVMRLKTRPAKLIVQGAGPIGLELAQFFARVGTEVVLVNRSPLLYRHDAEAGVELARALGEEPRLELAIPGKIEQLQPHARGLVARVTSGDSTTEHHADALLMAVGRSAAVEGLGLEHVGLELRNGRLEHDEHMLTARPGIYVAGDTTGDHQILHVSNQEGAAAGHNAAGGDPPRTMDYRLPMQIVFTDPPFAQVGATESTARDEGIDVVIGRARFPETGRAITMGARHGLWKLLADRETGRIVGSSILGPRADDLVHLVSLMMRYGATVKELPDLPWYHPTLSEVMLDLLRDLNTQLT